MLDDASILITGGSGTFGQAFARAARHRGARRVCIYSRGEHAQAAMRESLGNDARLRWFIGDVRDRDRLRRAMEGCDIVIHAAALKRVEVGEYDAAEMVKTNVDGALNVIEAAQDAAVSRVVALSTDKACEAINAYGASKLMAEKLFLAANNARGEGGPVFVVTRYGNVAGSAGSVIPFWRSLIARGESVVPATDPECTRFWMRLQEAVDLVWDAAMADCAVTQEPVVPDLPAYRLADLAAAMGVGMRVVGMRPGEKLHESMLPGVSSDCARRMDVAELRRELAYV